jgi:hypothetical protein
MNQRQNYETRGACLSRLLSKLVIGTGLLSNAIGTTIDTFGRVSLVRNVVLSIIIHDDFANAILLIGANRQAEVAWISVCQYSHSVC